MLGIVLGTGPSLRESAGSIKKFQNALVFGINNTFQDFRLDCWIACDPQWHYHYGKVAGDFDKWHWDSAICRMYGYKYIEGRWFDGLSTDPSWIAYNHCSSAQALNLAVHYGCDPILLVGHDFRYGSKRHYFNDLSETPGEYPERLRKWSTFDGLLNTYWHIAQQGGLPRIINCTPDSALTWFPTASLDDFCDKDDNAQRARVGVA